MEYLNKAFGGSGDRPTDGSRESERSHQIDRSEGRYDEPRYDNSGRNDEGRHGQGGLREEGQSSGGFLGSLGDKFGGGPQKGHQTEQSRRNEEGGGGGFLSGISNKLNAAAGGGPESEKNEDLLDKGVDYVQQYMGGGDQSNESAIEQAKDEQISDFIRSQYKTTTGKEFPIKDK